MAKKKRARNYSLEYKRDHASPKAKKARAQRNAARAEAIKEGKVKKGDGKEVHHKKPISSGGTNSKKNTEVVSRSANRKQGKKKGSAKGKWKK